MSPKKIATCIISHRVSLLSHVFVVRCVFDLCVLPRLPESDKKVSFFCFFRDGLKKVLTQGDFCAVPCLSVCCFFKQARLWNVCTGTGTGDSTGGRAHSPRVSRVDQGVQHVCKFSCECLDMCSPVNRP